MLGVHSKRDLRLAPVTSEVSFSHQKTDEEAIVELAHSPGSLSARRAGCTTQAPRVFHRKVTRGTPRNCLRMPTPAPLRAPSCLTAALTQWFEALPEALPEAPPEAPDCRPYAPASAGDDGCRYSDPSLAREAPAGGAHCGQRKPSLLVDPGRKCVSSSSWSGTERLRSSSAARPTLDCRFLVKDRVHGHSRWRNHLSEHRIGRCGATCVIVDIGAHALGSWRRLVTQTDDAPARLVCGRDLENIHRDPGAGAARGGRWPIRTLEPCPRFAPEKAASENVRISGTSSWLGWRMRAPAKPGNVRAGICENLRRRCAPRMDASASVSLRRHWLAGRISRLRPAVVRGDGVRMVEPW